MSGSAASASKKSQKGKIKVYPDYEPDLTREEGFQPNVGNRKEEKKKGSADIMGSSQTTSARQKEKKNKSTDKKCVAS